MAAGVRLKGLDFIKGKDAPVAKEDSEYPEWLWHLLDKKKGENDDGDGTGEGDLFCELLARCRHFGVSFEAG